MKTPYDLKPWPVRAYLCLRWRPWFFAKFCYWVAWWVLHGAQVPTMRYETIDRPIFPTRRSFLDHLWTVSRSMGDFKLGRCLTMQEWLDGLTSERA